MHMVQLPFLGREPPKPMGFRVEPASRSEVKRWPSKVGPYRVTRTMGSTVSAVLSSAFKLQAGGDAVRPGCLGTRGRGCSVKLSEAPQMRMNTYIYIYMICYDLLYT